MRSSFERFGGALVRLPGTARESDAILEAFGNEAEAAVTVLRRLAATEPAVREALRNKRYLHLAAHGLVGGGRADLFASLALTPPAASTTNASADGFLQLHEIYELQLADVELAVLSACNTNRGSSVDGEGVFALSRGFMAAGARRVIASQWAVNDASTAALMSGLFTQVVSAHRAGRPVDYATALRDAKRLVRDRAEWAAPFYWAPFVLMGRQ
jgi:CHAT domain-containing protein